MATPTLVLGKGVLPDAAPFDLSRETGGESQPVTLWAAGQAQRPKGDMWLDYPFAAGYQGLGAERVAPSAEGVPTQTASQAEPLSEHVVRRSIEAGIAELIDQGEKFGFSRGRCEMIITELLQNATQYGALSERSAHAGLVRFAWDFDSNVQGTTLTVAVSNPVPKLFNPVQYCNMPMEDFLATLETGNNGHSAVPLFVGYLTPGNKLYYLWDLPDGGRIVSRLSDVAPDAVSPDVMYPIAMEVSRYDRDGHEVPYSIGEFLRDVSEGLETQTVTVAGAFAKEQPEV